MYDLYNDRDIAVAKHKTLPKDTPLIAWSHQLSVKLENGTSFRYDPEHSVPDWVAQDQRHAYYADVSYVDENIGKILQVLEDEGMTNNTIIVVHADHGYHLGEHGEWEKKSNFDLVVRVPLMITVPWLTGSHGKITKSITELVDVGPTISSLAGIDPAPGVDGKDVSALFSSPERSLKEYAFHQYPACGQPRIWNHTRTACNNAPRDQFWAMGYSVRSDQYRYTRWLRWNTTTLKPVNWDSNDYAEELYNHKGDEGMDMDKWENENLAKVHPNIAAGHFGVLKQFFQAGQLDEEQALV